MTLVASRFTATGPIIAPPGEIGHMRGSPGLGPSPITADVI